MPVTPTYPGVYIEEIPSGVRTIAGVATSITAFVGRALRGAVNKPVRVQSFADFTRAFGGLWARSTMSYAVQQFFLNGGTDAIIVRVVHDDAAGATITLDGPGGALTLEAANEGAWGNRLSATVDHETKDKDEDEPDPNLFNLTVTDTDSGAVETFRNVSVDAEAPRAVTRILEQESTFVRVTGALPTQRPDAGDGANDDAGSDGSPLEDGDIVGDLAAKTGFHALEDADLFNLLCLPPLTRTGSTDDDIDPATWSSALKYCRDRRAFLIVDPPTDWNDVSDVVGGLDDLALQGDDAINGAIFFPRIRVADPLKENRLETFAPCGAAAGIFARTDAQRGVWKAPAGLDASLTGVRELSVRLTDGENGQLNPLGVNCLRSFPVVGTVVWGSRTIRGADRIGSEWKYTPVRRTALFIEESLYRGTQFAVFEPNDEPLWAQLRLNVGAFMANLFRQGAFQGSSPRDAYLVKCDSETTTQTDINLGIVNILVGFAPLKPAEFLIIRIQQLAGQIQT